MNQHPPFRVGDVVRRKHSLQPDALPCTVIKVWNYSISRYAVFHSPWWVIDTIECGSVWASEFELVDQSPFATDLRAYLQEELSD